MFLVNRKALDEAALEMQQQIRKLNQVIQETEQTAAGLSFHSGMEAPIHNLKKAVVDMEMQRNHLLQMMTVLLQIRECYGICERNIMDYADGAKKPKQKGFHWYDNTVSNDITEKIKQLIF